MQRFSFGEKQSNIFKVHICGSVISLLGIFSKKKLGFEARDYMPKVPSSIIHSDTNVKTT